MAFRRKFKRRFGKSRRFKRKLWKRKVRAVAKTAGEVKYFFSVGGGSALNTDGTAAVLKIVPDTTKGTNN